MPLIQWIILNLDVQPEVIQYTGSGNLLLSGSATVRLLGRNVEQADGGISLGGSAAFEVIPNYPCRIVRTGGADTLGPLEDEGVAIAAKLVRLGSIAILPDPEVTCRIVRTGGVDTLGPLEVEGIAITAKLAKLGDVTILPDPDGACNLFRAVERPNVLPAFTARAKEIGRNLKRLGEIEIKG